jgi:hypothetical protein
MLVEESNRLLKATQTRTPKNAARGSITIPPVTPDSVTAEDAILITESEEDIDAVQAQEEESQALTGNDMIIESQEDSQSVASALVVCNVAESEEDTKPAANPDFLVGFCNKYAKKERDRMVVALLRMLEANCTKRRSPIYRAARAVLVEGCKASSLNAVVNAKQGHRFIGQKARVIAKQDFKDAVVGSALECAPHSRKKVSDYSIIFAVTTMLSTENVGLWSWERRLLLLLPGMER